MKWNFSGTLNDSWRRVIPGFNLVDMVYTRPLLARVLKRAQDEYPSVRTVAAFKASDKALVDKAKALSTTNNMNACSLFVIRLEASLQPNI